MALPNVIAQNRRSIAVSPAIGVADEAPLERVVLNVAVRQQKQDNWCWASVGVGVRSAYGGPELRQCQVASSVLPQQCCPDQTVAACDVPHTLPRALGPHFGALFEDDDPHREFAFIREQIDQGNPVCARIDLRDGSSGHFVIIAGYTKRGPKIELHVADPSTGTRVRYPIGPFTTNYKQTGFWQATYTTTGSAPVPRL